MCLDPEVLGPNYTFCLAGGSGFRLALDVAALLIARNDFGVAPGTVYHYYTNFDYGKDPPQKRY